MSEMARAGFCQQCGQNVWLTPEGAGTCGHPAGVIENVYEAPAPLATPEPVTGPVVDTPAAEENASDEWSPAIAEPVTTEVKKGSPKTKRKVLIALAVVAIAVLAVALYPRPRFVATALEVPGSVVSGEDVVVRVQLANEGRAGGEYELTVLIGERPVQSTMVSLEARTEESVSVAIPNLSPGTYQLALAEWEELQGSVWVMTPPEFVIDTVDVSPSPMDYSKGDEATVFVEVSNIGEAGGSHSLRVTVAGEPREDRPLFIEGGTRAEETFAVKIPGPGACEIAVNDICVDLTVYKIEHPANGTAIVNTVGGGSGELRIKNNRDHDILVVLAEPGDGKPALLSVYVRANSSHTQRGIKNGTYVTYFVHGSAWCAHGKLFTQNADYGRFEGSNQFTSSRTRYSILSVEFGLIDGSGSPSESVGEEEFPTM